jgi:hypothetical protein
MCVLLAITAMLPGAELHRCLIRTGLAARVTHSIRVGGGATATRGIGVEPVIQSGDDQYVITIDVDIARSCPRREEVHRVASAHFVAACSEGDLPGCGCRRCSRHDCRRRCCCSSALIAVVALR